jgi:hypothetical protein
MAQPLMVFVPHLLGKDEAMRRLKSGLDVATRKFGQVLTMDWNISRSSSENATGASDPRSIADGWIERIT